MNYLNLYHVGTNQYLLGKASTKIFNKKPY